MAINYEDEYSCDTEILDEIIKTLTGGECCPVKHERSGYCPMDERGMSCEDCWREYLYEYDIS